MNTVIKEVDPARDCSWLVPSPSQTLKYLQHQYSHPQTPFNIHLVLIAYATTKPPALLTWSHTLLQLIPRPLPRHSW